MMEQSQPALLDSFQGVRPAGPNRYKARCGNLGHGKGRGDLDPSVSIEFTADKVLVSCKAGCSTEAVLAAAGLTMADLFLDSHRRDEPKPTGKRITVADLARDKMIPENVLAEWGLHNTSQGIGISYRDKDGRTKQVKQRTALSAKDGSYWPKGADLMAFGEHKWGTAQQRGEGLLVEGETDTITAWMYGWATLGIPGANNAKVIEARHLLGITKLYVVREPDEGGARFVSGIRKRLDELNYQGRVYEVRMDAAYKDINGLYRIDPDAFPQRFQELTDSAVDVSGEPKEGDLILTKLSDVKVERVTYLWRHRVPRGKLTLMVGDPGDGKSYISLAVAAAITNGVALPGGDLPTCPGKVLLAAYEDGLADTIRPRAETLGVRLDRLIVIEGAVDKNGKPRPFHSSDLDQLERTLEADPSIELLIVDPVMSLMGGRTDVYRDNEVRDALQPLVELAERRKVAVLAVMHLNKGTASKAIYRVSSSLGGFVGLARSILLVAQDADSKRRAIAHIKNNLGPLTEPMEFTISDFGVEWVGDAPDLGADKLLGPPRDPARREASEFLKLALSNGPRLAKEVEAEAEEEGIAKATLQRARKELQVEQRKEHHSDGRFWIALSSHKEQLIRAVKRHEQDE